uniref:Uncharacterized protein n=1 Tax=Anguilla anguilla TaxID=7936 RepID=A0A0E9XUU4_ANGAN
MSVFILISVYSALDFHVSYEMCTSF